MKRFKRGKRPELDNKKIVDSSATESKYPVQQLPEKSKQQQLILKLFPFGYFVMDKDFVMIDCNEEFLSFTGFSSRREQLKNHDLLYPEFQPDGRRSIDKKDEILEDVAKEGKSTFFWSCRLFDGEIASTEVTLIKINEEEEMRFLGFVTDLREIDAAHNEATHRLEQLTMLHDISLSLMSSSESEFDAVASEQLGVLCSIMDADQGYLWQYHRQGESLYASKLYEWSALPESNPSPFTPDVLTEKEPYLRNLFRHTEVINAEIDSFNMAGQVALKEKGVQAIMIIPLRNHGEPWGFVGLERMQGSSPFPLADEKMMLSAASLMTSIIVQNQATQELLETRDDLIASEKMLIAVNEIARILLENEEEDSLFILQSCLQYLGESIAADSVSMWRNLKNTQGSLCAERVAEWRKEEYALDFNEESFIVYKDRLPEWDEDISFRTEIILTEEDIKAGLSKLPLPASSKSVFLLPLNIQGQFWGFVGFDYEADESAQHITTEKEKNILRSGSLMIGSAIVRHEISDNLTKVETLASLDTLTQIENRGSFILHAGTNFEKHKAEKESLSILFLDIDHFKNVNDNYGHNFGDEVIIACAQTLKSTIRPDDRAARYGGEEFVVFLSGANEQASLQVADRIAATLRGVKFEQAPEYQITVSIGIVSGIPKAEENLDDYIKHADEAMYRVKTSGRNGVAVY